MNSGKKQTHKKEKKMLISVQELILKEKWRAKTPFKIKF